MSSTPFRKAAVTGAAVIAALFGSATAASAQAPAESVRSVTAVANHGDWNPYYHSWGPGGPGWGHHCRLWLGGWHRGGWCGHGHFHPGVYHPGMYHPGVYHPGVYHPGMYHPGVYHPGVYHHPALGLWR